MPKTPYLVTSEEMTSIADAIRFKQHLDRPLLFPDDFMEEMPTLEYFDGLIEGTLSKYVNNRVSSFSSQTFSRAFDFSNLKIVRMDNVESIPNYAFYAYRDDETTCVLEEAYFSKCESIGCYGFGWCPHLQEISFPKCKYISDVAFQGCTSLLYADFPECEKVDHEAFARCSALSKISFPKCKTISYLAFASCYEISGELDLPLCESIYNSAFMFCSKITKVSIPECNRLENDVFKNCSLLGEVYAPKCTNWFTPFGNNQSMPSLKRITVGMSSLNSIMFGYTGLDALEYISASNCSSISYQALMSKSSLLSIYAPSTKYIGTMAFYRAGLTEIDFPEVAVIEESAFYKCPLSGTVSVGPCDGGIGRNAFAGTKISEFIVSQGSMISGTISTFAFLNLSTLISVNTGAMSSIASDAFQGCSNLKTFVGPKLIFIDAFAFRNCNSMETVSLPECTTIYYSAFRGNKSPLILDLPKCKLIKYDAFSSARLQEIYAPECRTVEASAFYTCGDLTTAMFPSCSWIGTRAFFLCSKLSNISFPILSIMGESTFFGCSSLSQAVFPECINIGSSAFCMCGNLDEVYLPKLSSECYSDRFSNCTINKMTLGVSEFSYNWYPITMNTLSILSLPNCEIVSYGAFSQHTALESISIPSISVISTYAFAGCTKLSKITLGDTRSVTIRYSAFLGCENLVSVYLPNFAVTLVGESIFDQTPLTDSSYLSGEYGSVYVPSVLLSDYKNGTYGSYWTTISDRIVAISQE